MKRLRILLTNDDGYNAYGINLLKEKLSKYGDVTIIAPLEHMSGKSASITINNGFQFKQVSEGKYVINGTPADCVAFGLIYFKQYFDVVISGCNYGFNISYDTIYSGTIGACLQALTQNIPAIAFSCQFNFEIVEKYFDDVFEFILKNDLIDNRYLLNVNFPLGEEVKDIKISTLFHKNYYRFIAEKEDGYYVDREYLNGGEDKNSDCYLVKNGVVSITPLAGSLFNEAYYKEIVKKLKNK